jgi:hypothetical protein
MILDVLNARKEASVRPPDLAQQVDGHEFLRTTKLYDRTDDQLTLDEIEKISV